MRGARGRRSRFVLPLGVVAIASVLLPGAPQARAEGPRLTPAQARKRNAKCSVCHKVQGLSIHDPVKGRTLKLTIDPDVYAASLHGTLACEDCHDSGYERMPHSGPIKHARFLCVDCHERRQDVQGLGLTQRRDELLAGVHGRDAEMLFDCHLCHDPHAFQLVRDSGPALTRVDGSNAICLSCHASNGAMRARFESLPDTNGRHDLFPNPSQHLRKLKCITCHTPQGSHTRHDVEAATSAVRECRQCHGGQTQLLEQTYADLRSTTRAVPLDQVAPTAGDGVRDNVYVVGSTRSPLLDRLSIVGFALMLLLVLTHAVARVVLRRRNGGRDGRSD